MKKQKGVVTLALVAILAAGALIVGTTGYCKSHTCEQKPVPADYNPFPPVGGDN